MNMQHRFVHVGFAFPGAVKMRDLEPVFTTIGDWVRYSPLSWIVWTDHDAASIFLQLLPFLDSADQVLIAKIEPSDAIGRLTPWIWTWMHAKQASVSATDPMQQALVRQLLETKPAG